MTATPDKFQKWKEGNDAEIADLNTKIDTLESKETLDTREEDNLKAWRTRVSDLTRQNTEIIKAQPQG